MSLVYCQKHAVRCILTIIALANFVPLFTSSYAFNHKIYLCIILSVTSLAIPVLSHYQDQQDKKKRQLLLLELDDDGFRCGTTAAQNKAHEEVSEERRREIEKLRSEEIAARGQEWEDIERERRKKMEKKMEAWREKLKRGEIGRMG